MQFSRFSSEGEREKKEATGFSGLGFQLREGGLVYTGMRNEAEIEYPAFGPKASTPDGSVVASFL